jgi:dTDP-4-dehydrorhamnose reductase
VGDQRGCPTHAGDLAAALARTLRLNLRGVAHAAGNGDCSWHEFACAIVAEMGLSVPVRAISTAEAGRAAPRPPYTVLANHKLAKAGITLPHWKESLGKYMKEVKG